MKLSWIVFDLGGVLVPEKGKELHRYLSNKFNLPKKQYFEMVDKYHQDLTKGILCLKDFYSIVVNNINFNVSAEDIFNCHMDYFSKNCTKYNLETLVVINKFKKKYNVACLTNTELEIAEFNRKRGLFKFFDKCYTSTDLGMMKPDEEIFNFLVKNLNCKANEILFIDDKLDYVKEAQKVGINVIHFTNTKILDRTINELNIE